MRCHHHLNVEAVAICVSCGRGVCRDCFRSGVDGCTVCSPACDELAAKQKGLRLAMAESVSANASSYHFIARLFTLLEVICVLLASAVLIWDYLLPMFRLRVSRLDPVEAIGVTSAFAMVALLCCYAARVVRKIGDKFAEAERQLR
jgi:hypothetical protein